VHGFGFVFALPLPISEEFDWFGVVSNARLALEMSALLQYTSPASELYREIVSASLGTRPNQGGDRFQYPAPTHCLGYSLSPIRSVPRNVWRQEINVIILEMLRARALTKLSNMATITTFAATQRGYES